MKTFVVFALSLVSAFASSLAFAGVSDISPSTDAIKPSTVEHIYNLAKESDKQPSIRLVQVDNGGSSDITSFMSPSRLYLGIHQDGEEFNVDGNYLIAQGLVEVLSAKMSSATEISLEYKYRDEEMHAHTASYTILISDALKEMATAHGDDTSFGVALKSTIGMKNANP